MKLFLFLSLSMPLMAAQEPAFVRSFVSSNCTACHNSKVRSGNLDLTALNFAVENAATFAIWTKIHDRVRDGEMPPVKPAPFTAASRDSFLAALSTPLVPPTARVTPRKAGPPGGE